MNNDTLNTFLAALDTHPLLERLFFASAELAVLAALVALAITGLRIRSPRACAILWLIVLAKPIVTLAFGAVIPVLRLAPPEPIIAEAPLPETPSFLNEARAQVSTPELSPAPLPATSVKSTATTIPVRRPINWSALTPRILAYLWLAGVVALLGSTLLDRIRLRRFLARTTTPSAHASAALAESTASLQLRMLPPLRVTTELESPAVVGWFRSSIIIPQWLNEPANSNALAWALRHELTHLKHRDPIANALRRLAQILFFFHPVTWWASQRWEAAVELACDRAVVRTDDDVTAYAEQLYAILVQARQQRQRTMATGLFATRTQINTRIAALLGNSLKTPARLGIAAAATLTLFAGTVFAVGGAIAEKEEAKEETVAEEAEESLPQPQDTALQATCETLLEGQAGAIVVLNADTGAVLAMASAPFGTMKEVVEGQKASDNAPQIRPAYARAYQEQYPPGSTFKILLAAAALEEGVITPETMHFCGGSYRINGRGRAWGCWNRGGHDTLNVTDALAYSCDVFFYNVGLRLGVDKINAWSRKLGLGISTGIDLPREISGLIPSQDWKKQIFADKTASEQKWYPGDTVNLSIGQGSAAITPLQNAVMMAAIVNGGFRVAPRMDPETLVGRGERMLSDATLEILHAALRKTVEKAPPDFPTGTGWRAGIDGINILGKTGSAQIMNVTVPRKYASDQDIPMEYRDHAWFVAGVTDREPKISVSVLLEHGMHGDTDAAEIARAVIAQVYQVAAAPTEMQPTTANEPSESASVLPTRTLVFPTDRSLGTLYLHDPMDYAYTLRAKTSMHSEEGWELIGEAKGNVEIPAGKMVRLDVGVLGITPSFATLPPDGIQYLNLRGIGVAGGTLRHIAGWSGLEALSLRRCKAPDVELQHLRPLVNLRWLDLEDAILQNRDLTPLLALNKLRHLSLRGVDLAEGAETNLSNLGNLTPGNSTLIALKRSALQCVAALLQLQSLNLAYTSSSGEQLRELAGLTQLRDLDLENCPITNVDLHHLAPFHHLAELSLERTRIAEGYREPLAALPNLASVDVDYTAAPDAEHRMLSLGGRVVDEEGNPAPGVLVTLYGVDAQTIIANWGSGTSGTDGRWEVRLVSGWSGLMVSLESDAYVSDASIGTRPVPPDDQLLDHTAELIVRRGVSVSGTVRNEAGSPLADVRVFRNGKSIQGSLVREAALSDADGRFTVHHVDETRLSELLFLADGYAPEVIAFANDTMKAPDAYALDEASLSALIDVTLWPGAELRGEVRDTADVPVEGAVIRVSDWRMRHRHGLPNESRTDTQGRFSLAHMPTHGQVTLSINHYGSFNAIISTLLPSLSPLQAELVPMQPFRGRVVDAITGAPVDDYVIQLGMRSTGGRFSWNNAETKYITKDPATGEFTAEPRMPLNAATKTELAASVTAKGYIAAESAPVSAENLSELVTIKLQPVTAAH